MAELFETGVVLFVGAVWLELATAVFGLLAVFAVEPLGVVFIVLPQTEIRALRGSKLNVRYWQLSLFLLIRFW